MDGARTGRQCCSKGAEWGPSEGHTGRFLAMQTPNKGESPLWSSARGSMGAIFDIITVIGRWKAPLDPWVWGHGGHGACSGADAPRPGGRGAGGVPPRDPRPL